MWAIAGNMIYDEPPPHGKLYHGLEVLFASPDASGNERFARGCVTEVLRGETSDSHL